MKKQLIPVFVFAFLFLCFNSIFATVLSHSSTQAGYHTNAPTLKKPTVIHKLMEKSLTYKLKQTKVQKKSDDVSQGDKLAKVSLMCALGGVLAYALFFLLLFIADNLGIFLLLLSSLAPLAILVSLVLSIIALTSKDVSPKGKKNAKTALWLIAGFFMLLFLGILFLNVSR